MEEILDNKNAAGYVHVILPVKMEGAVTYSVPRCDIHKVKAGTRVRAALAGRIYPGVVESVLEEADMDACRIKEIIGIDDLPPVLEEEIELWRQVADYYMCTVGEVFKAAYPSGGRMQSLQDAEGRRRCRQGGDSGSRDVENAMPVLSQAQSRAAGAIRGAIGKGCPVLLDGVTGSGKTEIYITLASEMLSSGKSVLYLVPEIAISRQLEMRLENVFGDRLIVYHSKINPARKKKIHSILSEPGKGPFIILGLRSAVFLPLRNPGLIIVDEEHDSSYKQEDPAPRYNGRDVAVMAARIYGAGIILGSATPSFESLYNVRAGKYAKVSLTEKFHAVEPPEIKVIDTVRASKRKEMTGDFSKELLKDIEDAVSEGGQAVIFRNRRAYSPMVQCYNCGYVPVCPNCNVKLTYHKFNNTLSCHYCGASFRYNTICPKCASPSLIDRGAGTEKIEEELHMIFPKMRVARYDADITKSIKEDKKVLRAFEAHEIDVLVGTQMIGKGFDFQNVTLAAIINADTLVSQEDFRADEHALQVLAQLMGRAGRRSKRGKFVIQTANPDSNVIRSMASRSSMSDGIRKMLADRYRFNYPPFAKAIKIVIKGKDQAELAVFSEKVAQCISECGIHEYNGPFYPPLDMIAGMKIMNIWIWLKRNNSITAVKRLLYMKISSLSKKNNYGSKLVIDVDPL